MNKTMNMKDVTDFIKHLEKAIQVQYRDLKLNNYLRSLETHYIFGINVQLEQSNLLETPCFVTYYTILKDESACELEMKVFQTDSKTNLVPTNQSQFEKIWDNYNETIFSVYQTIVTEFEIFIKIYPVLRMNYLMNAKGLFLAKPKQTEELKKQVVIQKKTF